MVSYEVSIGLILVSILVCVGSLNFTNIILYQNSIFFVFPFFPLFIMWLVSILAETNRAPFDLPEAESELVSGFNVEYASMGFALFFLAEYGSIILMSVFTVIMFLGG
jgi:NADH-quinone oxidoreductase subunit H